MQDIESKSGPDPPLQKKSRHRIRRQSRSCITSILREKPLTLEQKELAARYVPLANNTARYIINKMKKNQQVPDEDSIRSEVNYELVKLASKVDPFKRLDGYFKKKFEYIAIDVYNNVGVPEFARLSNTELVNEHKNFEDDTNTELSCPYADDLRKWLDNGCDVDKAFPDSTDRLNWTITKLPAIKSYLGD